MAVKKVVGVMRRMTIVIVAHGQVDSVHILTKDLAVNGAQLCQYILVFLGSVSLSVAIGSFDELLSMSVLTASWRMLLMVDL